MIRGSVRECIPRRIESTWNANIHNRFDIEVRDAKTNELKQRAQAFNVICNGLWSNFTNGYFNYIVYSNGTGTPSTSDTTMFGTWTGVSATDHEVKYDVESGVAYRTRKIVLNETTANGMTITEVGIAYDNRAGYLCTHAMLEDMNGNPISITKTNTDILTIYATVYVHWLPSGQDGVILGPPNTYMSSSYKQNFLNLALGNYFNVRREQYGSDIQLRAGKGTLSYNMLGSGGSGKSTWNSTAKKLTYEFTRAAVGKCNVEGGFGWMDFSSQDTSSSVTYCVVDVRDEYEVTGEAVGTGDGSTTAFATKFDIPTNAKVYVDGVEMTSGVTVKPHPLTVNAMEYMTAIHGKLHDNKPCPCTPQLQMTSAHVIYAYNPLHSLGIGKFDASYRYSYWRFAFSDDLKNWSQDYSCGTVIPEEHRYRKYLRITTTYTSSENISYVSATFASESNVSAKNIIFDAPPAEGSVITIDYTTPFVPKDSNRVYDLSIIIQFGEYVE